MTEPVNLRLMSPSKKRTTPDCNDVHANAGHKSVLAEIIFDLQPMAMVNRPGYKVKEDDPETVAMQMDGWTGGHRGYIGGTISKWQEILIFCFSIIIHY